MNIDNLLNEMDIILEDAFTVPLLGKRVVDVESLSGLIEKMRLNMPREIVDAKHIVQDRNKILADARKEAENIVKKAEERARVLVSEQEIVKNSKRAAAELELSSKKQAKSITESSFKLCEDILSQTEAQLNASSTDIKQRLAAIRQRRKVGKK